MRRVASRQSRPFWHQPCGAYSPRWVNRGATYTPDTTSHALRA